MLEDSALRVDAVKHPAVEGEGQEHVEVAGVGKLNGGVQARHVPLPDFAVIHACQLLATPVAPTKGHRHACHFQPNGSEGV